MSTTGDTQPSSQPSIPAFDPDALREKYRLERDKRIRADGNAQYLELAGPFAEYLSDPYSEHVDRAPLVDDVTVAIIGGGFAGLITAARLAREGIDDFRIIEKGGDFGGTWYWNRYPGAQCDVESYVYLPLLEETSYIPTEKYVRAPEILEHCRRIASALRSLPTILPVDRGHEHRMGLSAESVGPSTPIAVTNRRSFRGHGERPTPPAQTARNPRESSPFGDMHFTQAAGTTPTPEGTRAETCTGSPTNAWESSAPALPLSRLCLMWPPGRRSCLVFQRTPSSIDVRANRPTDASWVASLEAGWQRKRMENFTLLTSGGFAEEDLVMDGWTDIIGKLVTRLREGSSASRPKPGQRPGGG